MKPVSGRGIGEQLAWGFGVLVIILAALLATVLHLQGKSADAEQHYSSEAEPARQQTEHLYRSVMLVGLTLRSYLLHGDLRHAHSFHDARARARTAVEALRHRISPDLEHELKSFLRDATALADRRAEGPVEVEAEVQLAIQRQELLERVQTLAERANREANASLATMATMRSQVRTGVIAACLLAGVTCTLLWLILVRSIQTSTRRLTRIADCMAAGDWKPALVWAGMEGPTAHRNEWERIARALGTAAWHLEQREGRLKAEGELGRIGSTVLETKPLVELSLRAVLEHVNADVGVVYLYAEDSQLLTPVATHSLNGTLPAVRLGEGLPGQAAKDGRVRVTRDIPRESPFQVKLGYDEAPPHSVVALPLIAHGVLRGVLLVASLKDLDGALTFLERAASQLALGMSNARAYETTKALLSDVQERSQLIQAQNEELQAQNEEIQAQSEEIQAQSEQLQIQHEEIQAQNEELKRHAESLELQGKKLRDADERKTEFLGVLAHELRNPLTPIVSGLFLLKQTTSYGPQAERTLEVIERQTRHLTKLIDDLLDVTRIAQGKVRLERDVVDLGALVSTCIEDHRSAIEHQEVRVEVDLPDEPVWIDGDPTRIHQTFGNLLNNAIKFTPAGGRISVQLTVSPEDTTLRVSDNGVGIEPQLLSELFAPFSQGSHGLARTKGGLGLGLALVKSLVTLHGGSVEAYSDGPGKGAEFVVRLPRQLKSEKPHRIEQEVISPPSRQVLVIEDSFDAADTLRQVLELDGHKVAVAHDGQEGLERAREHRPEIVLCDIGLPVLDGYDVAQQLRSDPQFTHVLLVAVSGYASALDRERAAAAGFDKHVAKPLSIERIREVIADYGAPNSPQNL